MLETIQNLKIKEDMKAAAEDLEAFSIRANMAKITYLYSLSCILQKLKPNKVPADMSQKFTALKNDVALFWSNFYHYPDEQKTIMDK